MQRRFLIMEVSDLFAIWFIVFLVLLTCIIVSSVILLSAFFFQRTHFAHQERQWKSLLRLFLPRRALVNLSRITCGITFPEAK